MPDIDLDEFLRTPESVPDVDDDSEDDSEDEQGTQSSE